MKKILSLFLSIIMVISVTSISNFNAFAATYSGTCGTNVTWTLNTSTGKLVISGKGSMSNYDYSSTHSSPPWHSNYTYIKTVEIQSGVTSIGDDAFFDCESLTSVAIPNSVISIGDYAFYFCTSLTSITIPNSVTSIGDHAFWVCTSLTSITVDSNNKNYSSTNGVLYTKNKTELIQYPAGRTDASFTVPSSVTSIGDGAFFYCERLTSIAIPNGVTSIGDDVFYSCERLTSITIPNSVTSIGNGAFSWCTSLTTVTMSNNVASIGNSAFYSCERLTSVYYCGNETDWNKMSVGYDNNALKVANKYYRNHNYNSGTITKKANCTATGVKTYTCTFCGATKINTIAKTTHTYKTTTSKATTKKNGSIVKKCSVCGTTIKTTVYHLKTITLSKTSYTYNGKAQKPTVTVKNSKGKKISASNYTVKYASGRKKVGKYSVKITFKGNYSGSKTLYFTIKPKATSVSSISTPKSAQIKLKWKKISNIDGYEIQVSKSNKFSSQTKKYTAKASDTNKTLKFLKKTKSYVRIRTYKKVNGKKYYSSWSKVKSIKTK
ncbi:MAG: leucine-rich repeat domain-containing protein [Eubacterium sp.]|nr:leucine-rich repeat domain-containing protein [Eubacterium sp.]